MKDASLRVGEGDRVGLVGRNGAGKTTLLKVLSGQLQPAAGTIRRSGSVGYLSQDPVAADPDQTVMARILAARGLDELSRRMYNAQQAMASVDQRTRDQAMGKYERAELEFIAADGYAAAAQASSVAAGVGLDGAAMDRRLGDLSGGQRRRVELARLLFSDSQTLLLDEPTNHLDVDSIAWLRAFLATYERGLIVISHDIDLVENVVTKVAYVDADRSALDVYNMGWRNYQKALAQDEQRRARDRAVAVKAADRLSTQADKMRAKATKARAAQQMLRRAEHLRESVSEARSSERVAKLRFPEPAKCGRVPLAARGLAKSFGDNEVFQDVSLAIDRGSRVVIIGLNGAGKTTILRVLAGADTPDVGLIEAGHGCRIGYYAQEHENLDFAISVMDNVRANAGDYSDQQIRDLLGSFLFGGDRVDQLVGTLSGGERTRLSLATLVCSGANVLLLDEPTNNLDPASRERVLDALEMYSGAILLVTHDEGAVDALAPERVLVMPDGDEDHWSDTYRELVALS
jgi:ATPase subunit of ABC transporter with duplicated ATPase domains